MSKSLYDTLGVSQNASDDEIKKSYRKLARQYHPDINKEKDAEEKFKEINAAYEILSDKEKRAQYDQFGDSMFGGQNFHDFTRSNQNVDINDILSSIFGGGGFSRSRGAGFGGGGFGSFGGFGGFDGGFEEDIDIKESITIPFESALLGGKYHYNSNRNAFDIKIPAGIKNGETLRIKGKGRRGSIRNGDLLLKVLIAPSNEYNIDSDILQKDIDISLKIALFGGKIKVQTPYKEVQLTIPANTKNHQKFRLKEQGMKNRKNGSIGDLYLRVNIALPPVSSLDSTLVELMKEKLPD